MSLFMESKDKGIEELVFTLRDKRDWVSEVNDLEALIEKLNNLNKVTSVRELSKIIKRSKSWIGISLVLIKGIKVYPEIKTCHNRNQAYTFLMKKNKVRWFL